MSRDWLKTVKAAIERLQPNLDHYRKTPRLGKVVKVHGDGDGARSATIQILLNNGLADEAEPTVPEVPLLSGPVPAVDAVVVVAYLRGDPDAPVVMGVLDEGRDNLSEVLYRQEAGGRIHVKSDGQHEYSYRTRWKYRRIT